MRNSGLAILLVGFALLTFSSRSILAQNNKEEDEKKITTNEKIQVTATRIPEAVDPEPASITIVTGDQLRATGANDLEHALSLMQGVSVAPGGDGGPSSSVPELWGLREFDAFLLVVDNVPWGGAFNPALATLDLNDIERIEVLRGAAPVMYGATSFVGVIHVIHRSASDAGSSVHAAIGNYSTGGGSIRFALPSSGNWKQALSANFDQQGYRDDRTQFDRGHVLYRGESALGSGQFHLDVDLNFLRQDPASPQPRAGRVFPDPAVPLDANHNPSDSQQDENRYHFVGSYNQQLSGADWVVLGAVTRSDRKLTKGFLSDVSNDADPNTAGFRQKLHITDIYLDTHFAWHLENNVHFIAGADYLGGRGNVKGDNFDYFINLDGSNPPDSHSVVVQERPQVDDERNFFGLYGQLEWNATARLLLQGGLRFNSTHEKREGEVLPGDAGGEEGEEGGVDDRTDNRLSGTIGVSYLVWNESRNNVWVFADYRNAFKPAAIDFGPEAEGGILEPETANSYEGGVKGESMDGKLDWEVSIFRMDFENLVTATVSDEGLPILINSGTQRFTGAEFGVAIQLPEDFRLQFGFSHHSAKFRNFIQEFDGVPTQLSGNKLEMSPDDLAAVGVVYAPASGFQGSFILNYIGDRFLNKRNTSLAPSFTTIALGAGYRFGRNVVRFDIENVTDERDPISESELGDAQYYREPARNFRFGWSYDF
jgi:iron complex outermembrane receptor protein